MRSQYGIAGLIGMMAVGGLAVACGGGSETTEAPDLSLIHI